MSSNGKEHIENSIKNSFDNNQRKAPEGIWSSISKSINLTDDEFSIKESFNDISKPAPTESWKNIKKQLIIDEVWEGIQHYNKRKRKFVWIWSFTGLILLLGIGVATYIINSEGSGNVISHNQNSIPLHFEDEYVNSEFTENYSNSNQQNIITNNEEEIFNNKGFIFDSSIINKITKSNGGLADENINDRIETNYLDSYSKNQATSSFNNLISKSVVSIDTFNQLPSEDYKIQKLNIPTYLLNEQLLEPSVSFLTIEKTKDTKIKRFEFGFIGGVNSTWIFNSDVREGLNKHSLVRNELSFGSNIGVVANYNFNYRSSISLNYDFSVSVNQNYSYFNHGGLHYREIQIKYQKMGFSYKLNLTKSACQSRYFTLKAGAYFTSAQQTITNGDLSTNDFKHKYNGNDVGVKLAFGYEHQFNRIKLSYGLQSETGGLNISEDLIVIPKKFKYASTHYMGVYVSIRYLF